MGGGHVGAVEDPPLAAGDPALGVFVAVKALARCRARSKAVRPVPDRCGWWTPSGALPSMTPDPSDWSTYPFAARAAEFRSFM